MKKWSEVEHALGHLEELEKEKWPEDKPFHTMFLREYIKTADAERDKWEQISINVIEAVIKAVNAGRITAELKRIASLAEKEAESE